MDGIRPYRGSLLFKPAFLPHCRAERLKARRLAPAVPIIRLRAFGLLVLVGLAHKLWYYAFYFFWEGVALYFLVSSVW